MERKNDEIEKNLTDVENVYLRSARGNRREIYSLEGYSRLWDRLDQRLGKGNDATKYFVDEYNSRAFDRPLDREESRRVDMMRVSFVFPRTKMPEDVRRALLFGDIFGRRD